MLIRIRGTFNFTADITATIAPDYEAETLDWQSRVKAAGGAVAGAIDAIDTYVKACKSGGIWSKLSTGLIRPYATDGLNGLFIPLVTPSGVTPTIYGFNSGDYSLTTGVNPGATNTTKYINTGYNPATWNSDGSIQFSVYLRTESDGADGGNLYPVAIGGYTGSSFIELMPKLSQVGGSTLFDCWDFSSGRTSAAISPVVGLISGVRISTSDARIFRNGTQSVLNSSAITASIPNIPLYEFARNSQGVADYFCRRIHSYSYIGPALTVAEEVIHYNAVQALQTALGRAV